jgi:hypothetical protein
MSIELKKQMKICRNDLKLVLSNADHLSMPGKPFQSKLVPFVEIIQQMRRQRKTWNEIAERLGKLGCQTSGGNLYNFFKRWKRRPYALGMEPEGYVPGRASIEAVEAPLSRGQQMQAAWEEKQRIKAERRKKWDDISSDPKDLMTHHRKK